MAKLFDLRPDKSLLDPTFEGYKLSLETLPVYQHEIPIGVEHLKPSDDQFSFQHYKSFGFHNHLIMDSWHSEYAYFISKDYKIFRTSLHSLVTQSPEFISVWQIPYNGSSKGCFNPTISFAGPHLAVIADGAGGLQFLDTSKRDVSNPQPWQVVLSPYLFGGDKPFEVIDSHLDESDSSQPINLHILLQRVESTSQVETQIPLSTLACSETDTPFVTLLEHLTYVSKDGHWELGHLRRLASPHGLEYASILPPGKALCVAARVPLGIIFDSIKSVSLPTEEEQLAKSEPEYVWRETGKTVTVWFSLGKEASEVDLVVEKTSTTLKVEYKNQLRLEGQLAHGIVVDESLWTLSNGKLEIILIKLDHDVAWSELIRGDTKGQKVIDPETASEWHQRLIHLTTEEMDAEFGGRKPDVFSGERLEECDAFPSEETYLMRIDGDSNAVSHKASLGSHLVLFATQLSPVMAPALCLRHDVDGLVWQPLGDESQANWGCLHTATFQALGYVQASKEQRKFTVCPPNFSYAACCDTRRHIYIYRQPSASAGVQLVHRPTGRRVGSVARQQVLALDTSEEFLGASATDTMLLILTTSTIFAIRINNE